MRLVIVLTALLLHGPQVAAQSATGDAKLSFRDGVVYDDDLVPGEMPDQPYNAADDEPVAATPPLRQRMPVQNSPNLIGPDRRVLR